MCRGIVRNIHWNVTIPQCVLSSSKKWNYQTNNYKRVGGGEKGKRMEGRLGRGHIMQFWVIFHCHLYWNATPVPSNRVILYMTFLLNISKEGGGEGGGVMCLLPFFFPRVKAGNISSCLVIITDQLLIKIKWSFLNFNTILQIMQKTQLIALLAKITFKNSTTQRTKII